MILDPQKGTGMLSYFLEGSSMSYYCILPHFVAVTLVVNKHKITLSFQKAWLQVGNAIF
jgi:hypothetical protein